MVDNGDGDDDNGDGDRNKDGEDDDEGDDDDLKGVDEVTDLRFGPSVSEGERDTHCAVGFPNSAFRLETFGCDLNPETGLCRTRGDIKVEIED